MSEIKFYDIKILILFPLLYKLKRTDLKIVHLYILHMLYSENHKTKLRIRKTTLNMQCTVYSSVGTQFCPKLNFGYKPTQPRTF